MDFMLDNKYISNNNRNTISDQEYLAGVFEYTKFVWNKLSKVQNDYEHIDITSKDADDIYKYMTALAGYDNLPQVVSDKKFGTYKTKCLYRGVKDLKHAENMLCDHDYHHGRGYTNGIFTAIRKDDAMYYTYDPDTYDTYDASKRNPENVITLKLTSGNSINYKLLEFFAEEIKHGNFVGVEKDTKAKLMNFVNFVNGIKDDRQCFKFLHIFMLDLSKLAIYLGYDSIIDDKGYIILNRGKILVSASELERIKTGAKNEHQPE